MAGPIGTKDLAYQAVEPYQEGLTVKNVSGGSLAVGDLVYVNGTTTLPATGTDPVATVTKADADAAGAAKVASYVVTKAMAANAFGKVGKYLVARGLNTSSYATVGDPVYLSTTAGGSTPTAPTLGNVQVVGYVAVKSATAGIIVYNLNSNPVVTTGALSGGAAGLVADQAVGAILASNIGIPVRLTLTIADGAGAPANIDFTGLPFKCRVRNVTVIKTTNAGGAGDTITVHNGTTGNAITDAMSINVADKAVVRAASLDDAFYDIAAGATIRVLRNKASANNVACVVVLDLDRVA